MQGYQRLDVKDPTPMSPSMSRRLESRREKAVQEDRYEGCKNFAFIFVGVITLIYTLGELGKIAQKEQEKRKKKKKKKGEKKGEAKLTCFYFSSWRVYGYPCSSE